MYRKLTLFAIGLMALFLIISCSSGPADLNPMQPAGEKTLAGPVNPTVCLGLWQVVIDPEAGTIDAVDLRNSDLIVNVLGFLEPPALKGLTIDFGTLVIDNPTVDVDVTITHPLPDSQFMGFDVRGVVFGPEVANADGLTIVCSPEFFTGVPFGYINGLLGVPDSTANYEGLAGYKYFCDSLGKNDDLAAFMSNPTNLIRRGVFTQNPKKNTRHYTLDWSDSVQGFFIFNYAVYANYDWPVGEFPYTVDDFDISTANSAEAYCCKITELANTLYYSDDGSGGSVSIQAEIWDWQDDIVSVTLSSWDPVLPGGPYTMDLISDGSTEYSHIYEVLDVPAEPQEAGTADMLITVTDSKTFGESWILGLLNASHALYNEPIYNCFIYSAEVSGCPKPTVESADPPCGAGTLDDVLFNCTGLVDGPTLGIKFTDGVTDWVGTDVHFISSTQMSADFDLSTADFGEELDIVVTNGCGSEGVGPATWLVLYYIHTVGTPNIDIKSGGRTPIDIAIDPSSDQVAISYGISWINWTNNYQNQSPEYYSWSNLTMGVWDAQPNLIWYSHNYPSYPDQSLCWSYCDFTGWQSIHSSWQPGDVNTFCDMANIQGSTYLLALYHWKTHLPAGDPSGSFLLCMGDYSFTYPAHCYPPWYEGTGTTGVILENVRGMDIAQYTGGPYVVYILEYLPGEDTGVVEKWQVANSPIYQGVSFGEDFFYDPLDITVDSNYYVYVLEKNADGDPEIWAYDPNGQLAGTRLPLTSAQISGDPLRIDCSLSVDEVHVIHGDGATRFSMY